jgi:hypothetical protein
MSTTETEQGELTACELDPAVLQQIAGLVPSSSRVFCLACEPDLVRQLKDRQCETVEWGDPNSGRPADPGDVAVIQLLGHAAEPSAALAGAHSRLRPGGLLVLAALNAADAASRIALLSGQPAKSAATYILPSLEQLVAGAGFGSLRVDRVARPSEPEAARFPEIPDSLRQAVNDEPESGTASFIVLAIRSTKADSAELARDLDLVSRENEGLRRELSRLSRIVEDCSDRLGQISTRVEDIADEIDADTAVTGDRLTEFRAIADEAGALAARLPILLDDPLPAFDKSAAPASDRDYLRLVRRAHELVRRVTPESAIVAVISRGDEQLIQIDGRTGWHFPRAASGVYAGHYPVDSDDAVAQIEDIRSKGAGYLLVPSTAFWWLDHYAGLGRHLIDRYRLAARQDESCLIFHLSEARRA